MCIAASLTNLNCSASVTPCGSGVKSPLHPSEFENSCQTKTWTQAPTVAGVIQHIVTAVYPIILYGRDHDEPIIGYQAYPTHYYEKNELTHTEVQKFAENGGIGAADDHLTNAVHAFVHFSLVYSGNCDLQGE